MGKGNRTLVPSCIGEHFLHLRLQDSYFHIFQCSGFMRCIRRRMVYMLDLKKGEGEWRKKWLRYLKWPLDSEMNRMNVWGPPMGKIVKHLNRYLNNGSCSLFHSLEWTPRGKAGPGLHFFLTFLKHMLSFCCEANSASPRYNLCWVKDRIKPLESSIYSPLKLSDWWSWVLLHV